MGELQLSTLKDILFSIRKATKPRAETTDGEYGPVWGQRDGSIVTMPWHTAMSLEGRVYNISHASPDTKMTGATAYDATHPGICVVAPAGTVMIPVFLNVTCEDMAGTDNHVTIVTDAGDLYSSGGTAVSAVTNLRTDAPNGSAVVSKYCSDSAITVTDPDTGETNLYTYVNAFADATTSPPVVVNWEPKCPPILVGPATFLVYTYGASTACEFGFSFQYIELPSSRVV